MDLKKVESVEETQLESPFPSPHKRVLYFASGETLEEDSSDEEQTESHIDVHDAPVDTSQLSWKMYSFFLWMQFCKKSLQTCDYVGEKLASLAGLNTPKYQYAVDEYHCKKKEVGKGLGHKKDDGDVPTRRSEVMHLSSQVNSVYGSVGSLGGSGNPVFELIGTHGAEGLPNTAGHHDGH